MSAVKTLLKSPAAQAVIGWLLALYIRLVYATSRKAILFDEVTLPYIRGEQNAIFLFWHGRMMLCPCICPPQRRMRVLISQHRDGLLISRIISHFNLETVVGSTSRGGKEAAGEILRALASGDNIGITPDGPRGPAQVMTKGALTLAKLSGKPLIPVAFASSRAKKLSSWDRFMLALPFGRVAFCIGAPMVVAEAATDDEMERMRLNVERTMNQLMGKAESAAHG